MYFFPASKAKSTASQADKLRTLISFTSKGRLAPNKTLQFWPFEALLVSSLRTCSGPMVQSNEQFKDLLRSTGQVKEAV